MRSRSLRLLVADAPPEAHGLRRRRRRDFSDTQEVPRGEKPGPGGPVESNAAGSRRIEDHAASRGIRRLVRGAQIHTERPLLSARRRAGSRTCHDGQSRDGDRLGHRDLNVALSRREEGGTEKQVSRIVVYVSRCCLAAEHCVARWSRRPRRPRRSCRAGASRRAVVALSSRGPCSSLRTGGTCRSGRPRRSGNARRPGRSRRTGTCRSRWAQ